MSCFRGSKKSLGLLDAERELEKGESIAGELRDFCAPSFKLLEPNSVFCGVTLQICSTVLHSQELEYWMGLSLYGSVCVKEVESTPWETEVFISILIFKMLNFLFLSVSKVTWRERLWFVTPFPSQREIVLERLKQKVQWL